MASHRLNPPPTSRRSRGIRALKTVPILPSLVTLGNVFFGFLAIAKALDAVMLSTANGGVMGPAVIQKLQVSALLIFVAMVFDALDGAVARMTRQTSAFGAQLDSMADMVTFGVAPALLAKMVMDFHSSGPNPTLSLPPKIIYVSAVVYVLCAAMRLARFNAEVPSDSAVDHQEFSGLPSPAAAACMASMLTFFCFLLAPDAHQSLLGFLTGHGIEHAVVRALPMMLVLLGLLMVSRVPYPHVVVQVLRGGHSFPFLASLVVMVLLIAVEWEVGLLTLIVLYIVFGMGLGAFRLLTTGRFDRSADEPPDPEPPDLDVRGSSLN